MIAAIALLALTNGIIGAIERPKLSTVSQWMPAETKDCVAIDAHVRNDTLYIMVAGTCKMCQRKNAGKLLCFFDTWSNPVVPSITRSPESRAGKSPPLYGQKGGVVLKHVLLIGCLLPTAPGSSGMVRVGRRDGEFLLIDMKWRMPDAVPLLKRRPLVVCSRLFARKGMWSTRESALLVDWLEWNAAQGALVHLYVHEVHYKVVWKILDAYERRGVVRVHDWPPEQAVIGTLWALGQVAYTADCLLRYEKAARYIAFIDTDEFLQPGDSSRTIVSVLDGRFDFKPNRPVVQIVRSFFVSPQQCNSTCPQKSVPYITQRCGRAPVFHVLRNKWILRTDDERPVRLLPHIHRSVDIFNTQPEEIAPGQMLVLHARIEPLKPFTPTSLTWAPCEQLAAMRDKIDSTVPEYKELTTATDGSDV